MGIGVDAGVGRGVSCTTVLHLCCGGVVLVWWCYFLLSSAPLMRFVASGSPVDVYTGDP